MNRLLPILIITLLPLCTFAKNGNSFTTTSSTLSFVDNVGQVKDQHGNARTDIDYKIATPGMSVFIGNGQLHYQWYGAETANHEIPTYRMDVNLAGANTQAAAYTDGQQAEYETHYIGSHTGKTAHMYTKVTYKNVYPNIDWVLYTQGNSLKYDFVVHPGGNPKNIQLKFEGASSLQLSAGALQAVTPMGSITEYAPYSYLQNSGEPLSSKYILNGNTLSFDVTAPAGNNTLVIDPVIAWATYFGGVSDDRSRVTTDAAGNVYTFGSTYSTANIATTGAFLTTYKTNTYNMANGYVSRFNSTGQRIWSTYLDACEAWAGCTDKLGNIYVSGPGSTLWSIATPGAYQTTHLSSNPLDFDGFVAKLTPNGQLSWATIYGGSEDDWVIGMTCDTAGNAYITGRTQSSNGITGTPGSHQPTNTGTQISGFVAKFSSAGQRLMGTYVHGTTISTPGHTVAVDLANNIYVGGETFGSIGTMPAGAFQTSFAGGTADGYIFKFSPSGTRIWSTYYGGTGYELIKSIVIEPLGDLYLYGTTTSAGAMATGGAYQPLLSGSSDAFLARFDTAGQRIWSTYYGGNNDEEAFSIRQLPGGSLLVGGSTTSTTAMASAGAYQSTLSATSGSGHFAIFNTSGQRTYGSYFGGPTQTVIRTVATDPNGAIYLGGHTNCNTGIATPGSFLSSYAGGLYDGFIAKFNADNIITISSLSNTLLCQGKAFKVTYTATGIFNNGNTFTVQLSDASGSFASPVNIGTVAATSSGNITCTIPVATPAGTHYRIRIVSTIPAVTSANNGTDLTINNSIAASVTIGAAPGLSTGPYKQVIFTATPVNGGATPVYLWKKNGTIIAGATSSVYTAVSGVDYATGDNITALLVSSETCALPDTASSNTLTMTVNLGVHDNFGNTGISIYPNPNNGHFTINGYLLQAAKMELVNTMGQIVYTQQLQPVNGKVNTTVNATTLPGGLYLLRIGNTTSRISIQRY